MESYLCPTLSLPTQLEMEIDKRAAATMAHSALVARSHDLIEAWYMQQEMINGMLGEIRQLQAKLALAGPPTPAPRGPEPAHYVMARELMAKMGQR